MKRVLSLVLIFILVFAVASCGDKKKKDDVKEKVSKEISAEEGGTVSTSDESVAVDIPADALDSNTTITVSVYESSHYATAKGEKVISTVVEFEPSGTIFKKPIIIKMTANNEIKDKVVAAAVYNEAKGAWSYSEHSEYAILVGKDAAGDPIMQTAAGDPIMLNAAGDPIMMSAAGDPIMLASAGDPIMLASAGDPIMSNAAGDPIMNAAAGDPIMMTTGHFTAYTFIVVEESDSQAGTVDADADTNDGDEDVSPDEDNAPECGNGVVEEGEECDNGSDNGKTDCAYGEKSCELCTKECKKQAGSVAYCGDGTKQGNEVCDKADPESGKGEGIGASCSDDCQIATLSCGTLPENAQWVNGDTYELTRHGEEYTSSVSAHYAESGDCAYQCKPTYSWIDSSCTCQSTEHVENGECKSNTQAAASCGTLPANAQWVSGDTYVPTWNGSAYSSASANYAEEGDCAYQCKPTYTWVETNETCACTDAQHVENDACVSNTGEAQNCTNIPANAAWKVETYTPHWVSGAWSTEPAATYFEDGGSECAFECVENFHYEEGSCQSDTKPAESCGDLPENAQWVSGETYVPTWYGEDYSSASAHYAEEGDCAYKCKATYIWVETNGTCACQAEQHVENDACVSDTGEAQNCTNLPSNAAWVAATYIPHWSNEAWSTEPEATYFEDEGEECTFECVANYHYEEESCQSDTKPAESCGELPENAAWVNGDTYIPTWNGKGYPYYTAHYAEEGDCAFVCIEDYEWNEDTVKCSAPVAKVLCTGQTKCYNDEGSVIDCPLEGEEFYGQDANYTARQSCTPQVYEKISEETNCISDNDAGNIVDDLSTGLRWYFYTGFGTWDNAYTFCDTLDTGEGREWRLPTAKELMSIIDSGSSYPALRLAYFRTGMYSSNSYWSGTYFQNQKTGEDEVLIMDTGHGYLQYSSYGKEGSNYFACVSGTEYGVAGTFTEKNISGGTVVTDSATNLMWKAATELDMNWSQALAYCEDLNYAGYSDWRLPNRNEFATILNYTGKEYGDSKSDFPDIIGGNYWTSTSAPDYGGSARAFIMEVGGGTMFSVGETQGNVTTAYTLCVRSDVAQYSAVPACDETGYTPCEDAETGIVWSQDVNDSDDEVDYLEAAMMCRESKQGGISQWRVATISEIRTILRSDGLDECYVSDECSEISSEVCYDSEICETGTAIESVFGDYTFMVSGTQTGEGEGYSWRVNFQTGAIESHHGEYIYVTPSIRCVKDNSIPDVEFPYTDDENSLVWSELSADQLSWDEANEYCTEDDEYAWRLPTIEELATLVQGCHDGGCAPDIYGAYSVFGDVSTLWSSTVTRNQLPTNVETYYNVLDFMTASQTELTSDAIRTFYTKVRCVADVDENPSPCDLYPCEEIENSDGTCTSEDGVYICGCDEGYEWDGEECEIVFPYTDTETNLTWSAKSSSSMYWENAGSYCENLTDGGYTDWRLPDIDELRTLIQECAGTESGGSCGVTTSCLSYSDCWSSDACYSCSSDSTGGHSNFGDAAYLWSSSASDSTDYFWYVDFDYGRVDHDYKTTNNYVRCVR